MNLLHEVIWLVVKEDTMGKLSEWDIKKLNDNPYVKDVNEKQITYTEEFKRRFIDEYAAGKTPRQIFRDAGFDVGIIGKKRIERAGQRWRENRKLTGHGRGVFTDDEINLLNKNDNVLKATHRQITYSNQFKRFFINEYKKGVKPIDVFREGGFDIEMIGTKRIERAAARWKKKYII